MSQCLKYCFADNNLNLINSNCVIISITNSQYIFQKRLGCHTVSVRLMKLIYNLMLVIRGKRKRAAGMALGAACYYDCGCICCIVMCSKIYAYFVRICYKFDISISVLILVYAQKLA